MVQRLLAVNAVSLVCALAANFALLLNMARRISFAVAQPITIIGWYISSALLLALIGIAGTGLHKPGVEVQALTGAYYYAIMAAVIYIIVASLMVITVWGAYKGHYSAKFELTMSQRTLMLQTISFMIYLLGGAAVFAHVESWQFLDAVYWADFTLLTVGIGDYSPMTHTGRALLFPYAFGGIVILGLVVGSIRSLVLERGKHKMGARMTEKTRRIVVKRLKKSADGRAKLRPTTTESTRSQEELERRKEEFEIMRSVQKEAGVKRKWMSLSVSGGMWFVLWFIGAVVFWVSERTQDWTYFQSLYFCYTSLLTIGYGDFYPMSNSGKPFFVFWSLLAVPTLTILISNMGDTIVKAIRDVTLYLGNLTLLPDSENGFKDQLRFGLRKLTGGHIHTGSDPHGEEPVGLVTEPQHNVDGGNRTNNNANKPSSSSSTDLEANNNLTTSLADKEARQEASARSRGDIIAVDKHHHRYLLIREIRLVYEDVHTEPEKQYSFREWSYFLKLIGEDEANADHHRSPVGNADRDKVSELKDLGSTQMSGHEAGKKKWSWVGDRSPLMGEKGEPRWVLEALCEVLEKELKEERESQRSGSKISEETVGEGRS